MPIINTQTGDITYNNTAIKMQERVDTEELYTPLYPQEIASNIAWNDNTLTLSKETGNSTYESKYRVLNFNYLINQENLFALYNCIYKYTEDTVIKIYDFSAQLGEDYFVDVDRRATNLPYLITNQGKVYDYYYNTWYDTKLTECTGISVINQSVFITTMQGLYVGSNNFNDFTLNIVADFPINTSFVAIDEVTYGTIKQLMIIATESNSIIGAISSLDSPTSFINISTAVSNRFHEYKNIIPELNLVVFTDGVWHTTDTTESSLNTGILRNLKDTQYIYYIKQWSASHYTASNNKWNMCVDYDSAGNIINSSALSDGSPMYIINSTNDLNYCLMILNNGNVVKATELNTTVSTLSVTNISNSCYRAPRYSYHNDIGSGDNSLQEVIENLDSKMIEEGRIFNQVNSIPLSVSGHDGIGNLQTEMLINTDNTMGCLYDCYSGDLYTKNLESNKWQIMNVFGFRFSSLNSNVCWYQNHVWGLCRMRAGAGSSSKMPIYLFDYDPVTKVITYQTLTIQFSAQDLEDRWQIQIIGDTLFIVTDMTYVSGEYQNIIYSSNFVLSDTPISSDFQNRTFTKVANTTDYTTTRMIQGIYLNNEYKTYAVLSDKTNTNTILAIINNNTITQIEELTNIFLTNDSYKDGTLLAKGKYNGRECVAYPQKINDDIVLNYSVDGISFLSTTTTGGVIVPKLLYLDYTNQWVIYEGNINQIREDAIYRYIITNGTFGQTFNGSLNLTSYQKLGLFAAYFTPLWYYYNNELHIMTRNGYDSIYATDTSFVLQETTTQFISSSNVRFQKVIKAQDKYILLATTIFENQIAPYNTNSFIAYSSDGVEWIGGYRLYGYYTDLCFGNGVLWTSGWRDINDNDILVCVNAYAGDTADVLNSSTIDMYFPSTMQYATLSIRKGETISSNIAASITHNGDTLCSIHTSNNLSFCACIGLSDYDEVVSTSYETVFTESIAGECARVVAGDINTYYFMINTSNNAIYNRLQFINNNWQRTILSTFAIGNGMQGMISEYDPVHDGIYVIYNNSIDIFTQNRFFHIGTIGSISNANQVGWFHGRYLYNILDKSATKSAYGIVPWFNSYPHDCKYLDIVIKTLCICEDKCFVITPDNKLYISSAT